MRTDPWVTNRPAWIWPTRSTNWDEARCRPYWREWWRKPSVSIWKWVSRIKVLKICFQRPSNLEKIIFTPCFRRWGWWDRPSCEWELDHGDLRLHSPQPRTIPRVCQGNRSQGEAVRRKAVLSKHTPQRNYGRPSTRQRYVNNFPVKETRPQPNISMLYSCVRSNSIKKPRYTRRS